MQPLALRIPAVLEGPQTISEKQIRTQTRMLDSPTAQPASPFRHEEPDSPTLPIMDPDYEHPISEQSTPQYEPIPENSPPNYIHLRAPNNNQTFTAPTLMGSVIETITWLMPNIPFELDLDIYTRNKLDVRGTAECLEKASHRLIKHPPPTSILTEEYKTKTFNRVVFSVVPNPSISSQDVVSIVRDEGLLGFFKQTKKYHETHFRVKDISESGQGRYVAFGKVKRGTFRGSGNNFLGEAPASAYDGAMLDGEHGPSAEFEAVKGRLEGELGL